MHNSCCSIHAGQVLFLPQVKLPLDHLVGRNGEKLSNSPYREADFLVYLIPGKHGPMLRVVILDVKTGYAGTSVDVGQAQDYFLALQHAGAEDAALLNAIHEKVAQKLPGLSPDMIDVVQVDWLFMPGKEQAAKMSAREVAVEKAKKISDITLKSKSLFNVYFYENGSVKKIDLRNEY